MQLTQPLSFFIPLLFKICEKRQKMVAKVNKKIT
nr:MAG TPA: hypothetical protein [Bacteriophage sp.]